MLRTAMPSASSPGNEDPRRGSNRRSGESWSRRSVPVLKSSLAQCHSRSHNYNHNHNILSRTLLLLHYRKLKLLIKLVVFVNICARCVSCIPVINDSDTHVIYSRSRPANQAHSRIKRSPESPITDSEQNYLTQFGYLPESNSEIASLRTEEQLRESIRNLQTFANITPTGLMDHATRQLMKRPRCGLPDIPKFRNKRHTLHGQRWHYTNLTWSLKSSQWFNGSVRRELSRALALWAKHSKLSFREVRDDTADIVIEFFKGYHEDGYPFDGRGQILAHAFFPGSGRGGDVHFDSEEKWLVNGEENSLGVGTSLFAVAAHEFGHSLGLSHSSVTDALMYPWYREIPADYDLPDDDRLAIQILYGPDKIWGKIPTYSPNKNNGPQPRPTNEPPWRRPPIYPTRTTTRATTTITSTTTRPTTTTTTTTTQRPTTRSTRVYEPAAPPRIPLQQPFGKPDTCDTTYDAVAVIRRETFIFKDRFIWRIGEKGLQHGYPARTDRLWPELPPSFVRIDAAYERLDRKIVFFVGKQFLVFDANILMPGYPKPLTALGLPATLDRIDAAFIWGYNNKTYFFSKADYWKFDEQLGLVELDYPRNINVTWRGVGYNIDAVFQWRDGRTYFFKGKGYWKFNDIHMRVENKEPMPSAQFWMKCPELPTKDGTRDKLTWGGRDNKSGKIDQTSFSSRIYSSQTFICLLSLFHIYVSAINRM